MKNFNSKLYLHPFLFLFIALLWSCSKDLESSPDFQENEEVVISKARAEFEALRTDVNPISFGDKTKNSHLKKALTVIWTEAMTFITSEKRVLDIPILYPIGSTSVRLRYKGHELSNELKSCSSRLIYEKLSDGSSRFYVVTLINHETATIKTNTGQFYKNRDFTGLALISDLAGNYLASYSIKKGRQIASRMITPEEEAQNDQLLPVAEVHLDEGDTPAAFMMQDNVYTHCGQYYNEGEIIFCTYCNAFLVFGPAGTTATYSGCYICKAISPGSPSSCLNCGCMMMPVVNAEPMKCFKCHYYLRDCICCTWCGKPSCGCCPVCHQDPCRCPKACIKCSNLYCNGNCQDSGGSTPGGDGSGGETNPVDPPDQDDHVICSECKGCRSHDPETKPGLHSCICEGSDNCTISLFTTKGNIILGEAYTVIISITGNPELNSVKGTIWRDGTAGSVYDIMSFSDMMTFDLRAIVPGTWNIRVEMEYNRTKTAVAEIQVKHDFPKAEQIKKESSVVTAMNEAWAKTKTLATDTNCAEVGFYIRMKTTKTGYTYDCSNEVIKTTPYTERASINLGTPTDDIQDNKWDPYTGGSFIVAEFHTHPPLCKKPVVEGGISARPVGPSKGTNLDPGYDADGHFKMPCFVYDYVGDEGFHYKTDNIDSAAKIYSYGGNQRENVY